MNVNKEFSKTVKTLKNFTHTRALDLIKKAQLLYEQDENKKELEETMKTAEFYTNITTEIDTFCDLLLNNTRKEDIIKKTPVTAGIWFGDYYGNLSGIKAFSKITSE